VNVVANEVDDLYIRYGLRLPTNDTFGSDALYQLLWQARVGLLSLLTTSSHAGGFQTIF
jgi:hypothetical protein